MGTSIFGIGLSGLTAAQAGLLTTSHNISNVNTPNYSRQEVLQGSRFPQFTGAGFIGQGVDVDTVRRVYNDFLGAQVQQTQAGASQLDTYYAQLTQLDNLFGDPVSGLSPALNDFFAGVNAVASHPADVPARQTMLSSAQALVSRFQLLDGQLSEMGAGVNSQISSTVGSINADATGIAELNKRITLATAGAGSGQPPNDLLDQRDALLADLNHQIGATGVQQSDGSFNVYLSNGQALVVGEQSYRLAAVPDGNDPQNLQVGLQTASGVVAFRVSDLQGGALGGLLAYRDNVLGEAENQLGRIAATLAQGFNDQHQRGQDLNGQLGGNFFTMPVPQVQDSVLNTGSAAIAVTITSADALTASDYRLQYDGANYTLTRLSDNTQQSFATLPQTVDGLQISLGSGAPAAGDSFLIQPTRFAARDLAVAINDVSKIAAGAPIRTSIATANTGSGQISPGSVDASYPSAALTSTVTLTYDGATSKLSGFPATQALTVTSGGTSTTYAAGVPVPYTAGATISFGGISIMISGMPANNDTFSITPNTGGAGDNRNAQLLAALAQQNVVANGSATLSGAYGQLVSFVGNITRQAQVASDAQAKLLSQVQQAQQSVSGVNLDEEAANLQRYQQAYQAAGKVMAIADSLFDTILGIAKG